MPTVELVRILLGLGIPLLLIGHAIATRIAYELYDASPDYTRVVWALWSSDNEGRQLALLVPGWLHGCLGIYIAFGHRRTFQRLRFVLFAVAVLLPVLAGLGFLAMGKELAMQAANRAWLDAGSCGRRLTARGNDVDLEPVDGDRAFRAGIEGGAFRGQNHAADRPQLSHGAYVGLRRACTVLYLPRARRRRPGPLSAARTGRAGNARAYPRAGRCPSRVSDPATRRCFRDTPGGHRTRRPETRPPAAWRGARRRGSLRRLAQPGVVQRTAPAAGRALSRESIHRSDRQRGSGHGRRRLRCRHGKRDRHLRAPGRRRYREP